MTGCQECGQNLPVMPLHGEKGGRMLCSFCAGAWHAKQREQNKKFEQFQRGLGWGKKHSGPDELSLEMLEEAITLTHPDRHPPERAEQAHRVTAELLALKPYVLPATAPTPTTAHMPSNGLNPCRHGTDAKPSPLSNEFNASAFVPRQHERETVTQPSYPCEECQQLVPYDYCDPCRATYVKIRRKEREREAAYRRNLRARKRAMRPNISCASCGDKFKAARKDTKYCSAACRQRAHRERNMAPRLEVAG